MRLMQFAIVGSMVLLAACAQTPAKIAKMSESDLSHVPETELCKAVNSSTRTPRIAAEVKRRELGCDSIATACFRKVHDDGSDEYRACVARIEERWEAMRNEHDRQVMAREMRRIGDPTQAQRQMQHRTVCRSVIGADGTPRQVCTVQ